MATWCSEPLAGASWERAAKNQLPSLLFVFEIIICMELIFKKYTKFGGDSRSRSGQGSWRVPVLSNNTNLDGLQDPRSGVQS